MKHKLDKRNEKLAKFDFASNNLKMTLYKRIEKAAKGEQKSRQIIIQDFLNSHNLAQWKVGNVDRSSGQSITCDSVNSSGSLDKLGKIKIYDLEKRENSKERFKREISILNQFLNNSGIINILDSNIEHGLLITERGIPLLDWWKQFRETHSSKEVYLSALTFLEKLAEGISLCHKKGIIHRDIKVPNIVVVKSEPKLIDFGIAYVNDSVRITLENEIIGNRFTSPSPMQNPNEDSYPWYDVYQLNQVFLWMVCEVSCNEWPRPLDWRFVKFPDDLLHEKSIIKGIRAFSAICSDFERCPQNGEQMLHLINNILITQKELNDNRMKIDLHSIENAKKEGSSSSQLLIDINFNDFKNTKDLFVKVANDLSEAIIAEFSSPDYEKLLRKLNSQLNLDHLFENSKVLIEKNDKVTGNNQQNYSLLFGEEKKFFSLMLAIHYSKTTHLETLAKLKKDYIPFRFELVRYSSLHTPELDAMQFHYQILINNIGDLYISKAVNINSIGTIERTTLKGIVDLMVSLVNDPEYWKVLYL